MSDSQILYPEATEPVEVIDDCIVVGPMPPGEAEKLILAYIEENGPNASLRIMPGGSKRVAVLTPGGSKTAHWARTYLEKVGIEVDR